jgi:hypothetical protein
LQYKARKLPSWFNPSRPGATISILWNGGCNFVHQTD